MTLDQPEKQIDKQSNNQVDRQSDKQIGKESDRQSSNRQSDKHSDKQSDKPLAKKTSPKTAGQPLVLSQVAPLLIVEDSNEDFEAISRFLKRSRIAIPIWRCANGEDALAFLHQKGCYAPPQPAPRPSLVVLDLNLPGMDGREVLRRIKQDKILTRIPVVVFTTSNNPKDIEDCHRYGVDKYIIKPIDFEQLKRDVAAIAQYWLQLNVLPPAAAPIQQLHSSNHSSNHSQSPSLDD